jgi:hypothetical protein
MMADQTKKLDLKSAVIGVATAVLGGLFLHFAVGYFSEKPNSEIVVEHFPHFGPQELRDLEHVLNYSFKIDEILSDIKKKNPDGRALTNEEVRNILKSLRIDELVKWGKSRSVYRISVTNKGTQSEKNVRIRVKDAVAYYKSGSLLTEDTEGYVSIRQVNPRETHEILTFAEFSPSRYSQPDVVAFRTTA